MSEAPERVWIEPEEVQAEMAGVFDNAEQGVGTVEYVRADRVAPRDYEGLIRDLKHAVSRIELLETEIDAIRAFIDSQGIDREELDAFLIGNLATTPEGEE